MSLPQFESFRATQPACRVVMEACASAHFWARFLRARGFSPVLLPPAYVQPYRRRKPQASMCEPRSTESRWDNTSPTTAIPRNNEENTKDEHWETHDDRSAMEATGNHQHLQAPHPCPPE
jgi:hypothetical protein